MLRFWSLEGDSQFKFQPFSLHTDTELKRIIKDA